MFGTFAMVAFPVSQTAARSIAQRGILAQIDDAHQDGDTSLALTLIEALYRRLDSYEGFSDVSDERTPF